jgi:hypothetical protein
MAESILTRHDLEAKIVKRCWEDEAFRKELTADPGAAFTKYLALPATSLPKIVIHEEPAGSWHIVLPPRPANADQLSEEDLEKVAGGAPTLLITLGTAAASGAAGSFGVSAAAILSAEKVTGW